ncbi:MAG: NUDIX domain-containing protein [Candidatus Moranbacteria bacterium]|nr:NUDIX domain-containing protein [Candidatus Moranbacteria bacterium]
MAATKKLSGVPGYRPGWRLTVDGMSVEGEWKIISPFGSVETAVVLHADGSPNFDRPAYREAPHVNCVVWGRDKDGVAKFAVIRQPRPHADDPEQSGNDHQSVVFGQTPMGFLEKIIGKDLIPRLEDVEHAAEREALEEAGARVVLNVERPPYPWHNPNPTFVATWADIVFIEVDLAKIAELKPDRSEPIFSAEYVTVGELRHRIAAGKDEAGAVYRGCTSNSVWLIFFALHPELWQ